MQPFWVVTLFVARALLNTFVSLLVCRHVLSDVSVVWRVAIAFLVGFGGTSAYDFYIFPYHLSPLRQIPVTTQTGFDPVLFVEKPRGKSALQWVRDNPDVEVIHSRGKLGQSMLYPISPAALRDVLHTNAGDFQKSGGLKAFITRLIHGVGLFNADGADHQRQRKSLAPSFAPKRIRELYPTIWSRSTVFADAVGKHAAATGSFNIADWASRLAFDNIGLGALSQDFHSLTEGEHPIAQALAAVTEPTPANLAYFGLCLLLPPFIIDRFTSASHKLLVKTSHALRAFGEQIYDGKQEQIKHDSFSDRNILSTIIASGELPRDQVVSQILTVLVGGHDTTASALSWSLYLLTMPEYKHFQTELRDEVRAAFPPPSPDKPATLSETALEAAVDDLPFLNGVCNEILRLYPAAPSLYRESIRTTTIAGYTVPAHTPIPIIPWAINRNPKFWGADAEAMSPYRWIDTAPDGSRRSNKNGGADSNYCALAFLQGRRACIGQGFARASIKCALAALVGQFEIGRVPGDNYEVDLVATLSLKPLGGLNFTVERVAGW